MSKEENGFVIPDWLREDFQAMTESRLKTQKGLKPQLNNIGKLVNRFESIRSANTSAGAAVKASRSSLLTKIEQPQQQRRERAKQDIHVQRFFAGLKGELQETKAYRVNAVPDFHHRRIQQPQNSRYSRGTILQRPADQPIINSDTSLYNYMKMQGLLDLTAKRKPRVTFSDDVNSSSAQPNRNNTLINQPNNRSNEMLNSPLTQSLNGCSGSQEGRRKKNCMTKVIEELKAKGRRSIRLQVLSVPLIMACSLLS